MSTSLNLSKLGYGLMNFTTKPVTKSDDVAFDCIKTAIDGGSTFLNSGDFYGIPEPYANLELLNRFYEKYPDYADKTFLSVKGGVDIKAGFKPDNSTEYLRRTIPKINEVLGGKKRMDLYQNGRVDKSRSIEDIMKDLVALKEEGHFKYIGVSEVNADTLRRAHAVHPVALVEVEYSLWAIDIEKNQVLDTCRELGIPVIAYSPLGRGALTGQLKSPDDIPEGDMRKSLDRFQPENWDQNMKFVQKVQDFAQSKGITPTQLSLAWLMAQGNVVPIPGSTRPEGVKESLGSLNVKLTSDDLATLRQLAESADIIGGRYNDHHGKDLEG